ncbi:MAG: glycosyltransferase [Nitrospirae bacterium]|nr:glycosyltransferase [Nitrospirota bacterium]
MNILILSPFLPWPISQGGKIRAFNIIKYLSVNHKITLACLSEERISDYGPLADFCEEVICIERRRNIFRDLPPFLFGSKPFNFVRFSSVVFSNALKELLKRKSFDLIQIEFSMMWQYADIFKGVPAVLDAHNIESEIVKQIGNTQKNPVMKLLYVLEKRKLIRGEAAAWRGCDICFAVSESERTVIVSHADPGKVYTAPNGVDCTRFEYAPKSRAGKQLLFIGGMDYLPNADSALYLIEQIWPLVRAGQPDARLEIVGRNISKLRMSHATENIGFHENVPDILPYFRDADLLLVPLRSGAGTRIKILEAMAAGLPVVTTSKGCEGIEARDREHLMVADTPADFAGAIRKILGDPGLRSSIIQNARRLVETKYSWEKIVTDMEKLAKSKS